MATMTGDNPLLLSIQVPKPRLPRTDPPSEHPALGHVPLLKWPGGKRWIAPTIAELLSGDSGRYVEPFLGGGAVFFRLLPPVALLADVNRDLMATYRVLRDTPDHLFKAISRLGVGRQTYERVRAARPTTATDRAARLMYLNRTAFNGLYRVNRLGQFNVPFGGRAKPPLFKQDVLRIYAGLLQPTQLVSASYVQTLSRATALDRIYIDPPYAIQPGEDFFGRYHSQLFTWPDQRQLAERACLLAHQGARIIVTNALNREVLELYPRKWFRAFVTRRISRVAAAPQSRRAVHELMLVSRSLAIASNHLAGAGAPLTALAR
jgi:DNA adenine methylase